MSITARLPAVSEHSGLRYGYIFMVYIAQGIPYGLLFLGMPAWLAGSGLSAAAVGGYVSASTLPWALKFVHGFLMDRYTYLPMGKRRAWLVGAQLCMVLLLCLCALVAPRSGDIALISAFGFAINVATTLQDVAIDGMAVDLVPDDERPRANGFMFGGQNIGIAAGGAGGGILLAAFGLQVVMLAAACIVAAILLGVLALRERPGERILPWSAGEASPEAVQSTARDWPNLLRSVWRAMVRPQSLIVMPAMVMQGMALGILLAYGPILAVQGAGWSNAQFSSTSGSASLLSGILGATVFGWVVQRTGVKKNALIGFGLLIAIGITALLVQAMWSAAWVVIGFVFGCVVTDLYLRISMVPTCMRLCDPKVSATQFALYMAIYNLGTTISAALIGPLEGLGGPPAVVAVIPAVCFIGLVLMSIHAPNSIRHARAA